MKKDSLENSSLTRYIEVLSSLHDKIEQMNGRISITKTKRGYKQAEIT